MLHIKHFSERSKKEVGLIDQLPDDVKAMVTEKLHSLEVQQAEIITDENPT